MKKENTGIKIASLELENVKRVKAVSLAPAKNGLTVIGGNNGQGKTTVLDAIAYALGGGSYRPSMYKRDGSMSNPRLRVTLSNGIVVERTGEKGTLKVTDPSGKKAGQALLDSFVGEFALNLPKFIQSSEKEKTNALLQAIGVADQLATLESQRKRAYDDRQAIGRIYKQKKAAADEMTEWDNVPDHLLDPADLIRQQQEIMMRNADNQKKRNQVTQITQKKENLDWQIKQQEQRINEITEQLRQAQQRQAQLQNDFEQAVTDESYAMATIQDLQDESTAELEASIAHYQDINAKISQNLAKGKALEEAQAYESQYQAYTQQIDQINKDKISLFSGARLPLPGLCVDDGSLTYNGQKWDCMSGSDQLMVAAAIARAINPQCGFVLMDKLEQMDLDTMNDFATWLQKEGLQAIATRVGKGDECTIYIEDGYSVDHDGNRTADTDIKPATAFAQDGPAIGKPVKNNWVF